MEGRAEEALYARGQLGRRLRRGGRQDSQNGAIERVLHRGPDRPRLRVIDRRPHSHNDGDDSQTEEDCGTSQRGCPKPPDFPMGAVKPAAREGKERKMYVHGEC